MEANVYHSRSDEELFALLRRKDDLALQVLFNRYHRPLCRFAQIYIRDFTFAPDEDLDHLDFLSDPEPSDHPQVWYHQLIAEYFDQSITDENLAVLLTWVGRTEANEEEFRETILLLEGIEFEHKQLLLQGGGWDKMQSGLNLDPSKVRISVLDEEPLKVQGRFVFLSISASFIALLGIAIILYFHFAAHKARVNMHRYGVVSYENNTAKMSDIDLISL